jgi:hypothetical protein
MSTFLPQYLAATATFFLLGLLFSLAERRWPLRPVNRRRELGLDVGVILGVDGPRDSDEPSPGVDLAR